MSLAVIEREGELLVDSRLVATSLGVNHSDWIQNVVKKYQTEIEQRFGQLRFENGAVRNSVGAVNKVKFALLTENQSIYLMTLSRNTPQVMKCKADLVEAFSEARQKLQSFSEPQRPEYIAEIAKLIVRLDVIKRLEHLFAHWDTEATGQLLKLLNLNCDQAIWEHFTPHELTVLRQQLRRIGETLETFEQAIASQQLIPETEKAFEIVKASTQIIETAVDLGRATGQAGTIFRYPPKLYKGYYLPRVDGERDPDNPNHWYWGYSYKIWRDESWVSQSCSIKRRKLRTVQEAIAQHKSIDEILRLIED